MKGSLGFWDDYDPIWGQEDACEGQCEKIWRTTTKTKTETKKEWAKVKVARSRLLCKASLCRWRSWRACRRGGSRPDGRLLTSNQRLFKKQSKGFRPRLPTCGYITPGKTYFFYLVAKKRSISPALHFCAVCTAFDYYILADLENIKCFT